ncbi:hypothetical protein BN2127_JRS8_01177 [Bacillus amyloliquefaciens]|nr:hypothetical protein BN2127_JRS8_01177 [Bacillus amyloliquefaciens]
MCGRCFLFCFFRPVRLLSKRVDRHADPFRMLVFVKLVPINGDTFTPHFTELRSFSFRKPFLNEFSAVIIIRKPGNIFCLLFFSSEAACYSRLIIDKIGKLPLELRSAACDKGRALFHRFPSDLERVGKISEAGVRFSFQKSQQLFCVLLQTIFFSGRQRNDERTGSVCCFGCIRILFKNRVCVCSAKTERA